MSDLFAKPAMKPTTTSHVPLAEKLRPQTMGEIVGQDHLLGENGQLTRLLKAGHLPSLIFWGPPGCGKTTMARLLANEVHLNFVVISAIFSGVADLKSLFQTARHRKLEENVSTLLFVDEIHRFNKSQQDAFLPVVEDGTITLIGATTENPSFELNSALLSRAQVLVLNRLDTSGLEALLQRAEAHYAKPLPLTLEARNTLLALADGDGRYLLTLSEALFEAPPEHELDVQGLLARVQKRAPLYDKKDDGHYNLISALHKSVRGSDVDAALYWFARMLAGGEDPRYLARRMIRMAVEDIGLADPQAMQVCLTAWETYERLGSPEGELALSQALIYLATAPKSNANYTAYKAAVRLAKTHGSLMPPKHILNAPTKLMQEQGYAQGYQYDHDTENAFSGQDYFPEEMGRQVIYNPPERGFEREIRKRLEYWDKLRKAKN